MVAGEWAALITLKPLPLQACITSESFTHLAKTPGINYPIDNITSIKAF